MAARGLTGILRSGVAMGLLVSAGLIAWAFADLGGWTYYRTPLAVRAYASAHRTLRPSGPIGQTFGVIGAVMMLVPFAYMGLKRLRRSSGKALRCWLEVHLFCGIVGPVLVTLHTSFKFNGIVSAAYWSMMIVMLSGFVGRYLYVRIPRSIRGVELSHAELDAQAQQLHDDVEARVGGAAIMAHIDALERRTVPAHGRALSWTGLLFGEIGVRLALRRFRAVLAVSGLRPADRDTLLHLTTERVLLLRRAEYLQRTKQAFALWHVFHLPLVYVMLAIVTLHVGVALYMGYVPFRW
jgi:hypothetical protein